MRPYSCNSITEINATYEPCHFLSGRVFYLERESSMQYIYQRRFWTFLGLFSPTVWSRGQSTFSETYPHFHRNQELDSQIMHDSIREKYIPNYIYFSFCCCWDYNLAPLVAVQFGHISSYFTGVALWRWERETGHVTLKYYISSLIAEVLF